MKKFAFALLGSALLTVVPTYTEQTPANPAPELSASQPSNHDDYNELIQQYCVRCHGRLIQKAEMSLLEFDVAAAADDAELAEKMVRKLRTGMMPPAGQTRPDDATLKEFATALETQLDAASAADPNPGLRSFQRLNRADYAGAIRDLLDLNIDAGDYLPLDTKSANFDNIADTQIISATLLESYLTAATEVSRLAVGDADAPTKSKTFRNTGYVSQWERIEGAPRGTRGGLSGMHNFPADADYVFHMAFEHGTTGGFVGSSSREEQIDISIDGRRVALVELDQYMSVSDPNGAYMWTEPIFVRAGPHQVSAAFLRQYDGPLEDPLSPYNWSLISRGRGGSAMTVLAHMKDLAVKGPYNATGVSETPSRRKVFTRRPISADDEQAAAEEIITTIGTRAFRRPLAPSDLDALMSFYQEAAAEGGFELGIRTALQAILSSPKFVFRFEEPPENVQPGENYRISDLDLASRVSFFLWSSIPDDELRNLAAEGQLSDPDILEEQVRRMLKDPRADAMATRFAAQWLRIDDLEKVHPDRLAYPDFHEQIARAMREETETWFNYIVREDRSVFEVLTSDYTFVNGLLARHYGIPDLEGTAFRQVPIEDDDRRGILGHGSFLTQTSHASRTSAVLRGKWVMEVLMGSPPPAPPPNVPGLDETESAVDGRLLTVAERMAMHRANPACTSCHLLIDPIGVALENFDVTGRWRIKDNLNPIDTKTELYDGNKMASPGDLRRALLRYPEAFVRNFIENLMAYGLGRRTEYYDGPRVRQIAKDAAANGNRMSSFILGVIKSPAFQMSQAKTTHTPSK